MHGVKNPSALAISTYSVNREFGPYIEFLRVIKKNTDVFKVKSKRRSSPRDRKKVYRFAEKVVENFDEKTNELIRDLKKQEVKKKDLDSVLEKVEENHRRVEEALTNVEISTIRGKRTISPQTYFMAKKHFRISKILLEVIRENKKELDLEEAKNDILNDERSKEFFKLGVFIASEPLLVFALIYASLQEGGAHYINEYSKLINRFSFMFAREFQDQFEKETRLNEPLEGKKIALVQGV